MALDQIQPQAFTFLIFLSMLPMLMKPSDYIDGPRTLQIHLSHRLPALLAGQLSKGTIVCSMGFSFPGETLMNFQGAVPRRRHL